MKRPLYYLLCAIACTSMVGATLPMAAIAEAIQPQESAEQQARFDTTNSDAGKAEDGTNTNATADTAEDGTATSTGTSAANTESADGATATPGTPTPSLRAQATPAPAAISTTSQTGYAHSATATQNGVTFTVSWNDAPAGTATTFHITQTNGSSQAKARMDVPTYRDGGSHESVCDPSRPAWASYYSLGTAGHDFTFDFTASGTYRIHFYFMDNDRYDPQNDKGIYYLRTTAEVTVNDAARPSVTQIVNNAVAQCRQQTDGSEYDMALWLHDWTLDQLEYDHGLNWCSAESGLTRHQGTCESYQRIYSKLLDAAGIANGRITGNGHTWNAVKIEGKWCQMDLTWDDTSDNWYGDLDQRHLYFGLTDELMTIAHSDHTANYQKDGYAYRSTDLSNNYFVRNGKADEWVEKYADRIQQHLDAREESFSIDADNQLFPPSISGIQNGIVAYAMNQRRWKVQGAKVVLAATSNVATLPNSTLTVKYDCTAKYQAAQVKPVQSVPDGEYMICNRGLGTAMLDISEASRSNGANAQLWEANGSGAQRFMISYDECAGAYEIMCAASGLALDVDCADFSSGANVQLYESNGSAAQSWRLAATGRNPLSDRHGEGTKD
ncbi:RICIN domain-containing protein [Collinsella aerofaciens]|uniref:RICIN domain-containing protein n=1 Tax=Collinsella aerofaciens TaxID=74426 RepID=UPI00232D552F|nr:RICIN domain-containing protein [Collinsella aerofaciens]MDB1903559.1 RICIN domain-containing protein [Collinsella aerofaciens]